MSKQALLGKVLNLGQDDLVQSVGQGGKDSAIDYRGISNFIKTKRVAYTVTSQDAINSFSIVQVTWDVPFPDAKYTVIYGVEDVSGETVDKLDYAPEDIHLLTAAGFQAVPVTLVAGNIIIHAIAIHD